MKKEQKRDYFEELNAELFSLSATSQKELNTSEAIIGYRILIISENDEEISYTVNINIEANRFFIVKDFSLSGSESRFNRLNFYYNRESVIQMTLEIEFILSQIIYIYVNKKNNINFFDNDFGTAWNDILSKISLQNKVALTRKWGLLKKQDKKKLERVINIRNKFVHSINEETISITLDGKKISWALLKRKKKYMEEFGKLFGTVYRNLIGIYKDMWDPQDMATYILKQIQEEKKKLTKQ